jgi:putative phosphoribosyl transferase
MSGEEETGFGPFIDRADAGCKLALKLATYANRPGVLVLALPRGGVPVAFEIAFRLNVPLDVFLVRKLGLPGQRELAMGAIASGGIRVLNERLVQELSLSETIIEAVTAREQQELERREKLYRGSRAAPEIKGRSVIVVDDGMATGTTMLAAVTTLKQMQPDRLIIAVPVAPPEIYAEFGGLVDEIVCLLNPQTFFAIGLWYEDFSQTTDQEVCDLLARAAQRHLPAHSPPAPESVISAIPEPK